MTTLLEHLYDLILVLRIHLCKTVRRLNEIAYLSHNRGLNGTSQKSSTNEAHTSDPAIVPPMSLSES